MYNKRQWVIPLTLLFLLCSCASFTKVIKENVHYRSGKPDNKTFYNLIFEDIQIRSEFNGDTVIENTRFILNLLKNNYAQKIQAKAAATKDLYVQLVIKEEIFVKEFESLNTIGLEMEFYTRPEGTLEDMEITTLYTEETSDTIASYAYLYAILERVFNTVFY